jgi:hypothetical protein
VLNIINTILSRFRLNNISINSSEADEKRSCWAVVCINGFEIDAKIVHRRKGKFEILEDNYRGKYIREIVDASDVIRCKVQDDKALKRLTAHNCPRCNSVNTFENKQYSKCGYEFTLEQIRVNEDLKLKVMEERHKQDIEAIRREMNLQFSQIMSIIQENYKLAEMSGKVQSYEISMMQGYYRK